MVAYQIFWGDLICMYVTLMHEIGITIIMPPVWSTCKCVLSFRRLLPRHPKVFWVTTPFPLWTDDTEDCLPWSSSPARHDLLSNMLNFNGQHLAFLPFCSSLNMADGFCFSHVKKFFPFLLFWKTWHSLQMLPWLFCRCLSYTNLMPRGLILLSRSPKECKWLC